MAEKWIKKNTCSNHNDNIFEGFYHIQLGFLKGINEFQLLQTSFIVWDEIKLVVSDVSNKLTNFEIIW